MGHLTDVLCVSADVCWFKTWRNSSNPHKYDVSFFALWWLAYLFLSYLKYASLFTFFFSISYCWLYVSACSFKCWRNWYVRQAWSGSWYKHMESKAISYFQKFFLCRLSQHNVVQYLLCIRVLSLFSTLLFFWFFCFYEYISLSKGSYCFNI